MRDAQIHAINRSNAKRDALIFQQLEFLQTRIDALEGTLAASKLTDRARWFKNPEEFKKVVDAVQAHILNERRKAMQEEAAKAKIEVVPAGVI